MTWLHSRPLIRHLAPALIGAALLVLSLGLYVPIGQHNPLGFDFRDYYIAATEAGQGQDAYNSSSSTRLLEQIYHVPPVEAQQDVSGRPNFSGPFATVLARPSTLLSAGPAYVMWAFALVAALLAALALVMSLWPLPSGSAVRIYAFGASPAVFWSLYGGQTTAFVLAAWMATLVLFHRGRHLLAGLTLAIGLALKPQLMAGPAVLLAVLLLADWATLFRYAGGITCGFISVLLSVQLFAGPEAIGHWLTLIRQTATIVPGFDDVSSLSSLYMLHWPRELNMLNGASIVGWAAICAGLWYWRGRRDSLEWLLMGSVLWLLVTPYIHSHDNLILLPALWLFWRRRDRGAIGSHLDIAVLVVWWVAPYLTITNATRLIHGIQGLGIVVPIALAIALLQLRAAPISPDVAHGSHSAAGWEAQGVTAS